MTYMLLLNCALKLVEEIILYYDARSKKHQITKSCQYVCVNYFKMLDYVCIAGIRSSCQMTFYGCN